MASPAINRAIRGMNTIIRRSGAEIDLDDIRTADLADAVLGEVVAAIIEMEATIEATERSGRPPDSDWWRRVRIALERRRYQRPRLQKLLDQLRKAEREMTLPAGAYTRKEAMRKAFIRAAEVTLDRDLFVAIWDQARAMQPQVFEGAQS